MSSLSTNKEELHEQRRFELAKAAMQGMLSTITIGREENIYFICETSINYADALLKALEAKHE